MFRQFSDGKREAGKGMMRLITELVVAKDNEQCERGKGYSAVIRLSREYCKIGTKGKTIRQIMSDSGQTAHRIVQDMHASLANLQTPWYCQ